MTTTTEITVPAQVVVGTPMMDAEAALFAALDALDGAAPARLCDHCGREPDNLRGEYVMRRANQTITACHRCAGGLTTMGYVEVARARGL